MRTVHHGHRQVELPVGPQPVQQDLVDLVPYARLLPGRQIPPATHARSAAHLPGQVFPRDAALEDEQDAREHLATVQGLAAGISASARLGRRQKGFDHAPQFVVQ